jgi:hypothetical protein
MKEKKSVMHFRREVERLAAIASRVSGISLPWLPSQKRILGFNMPDPHRGCRERLVRRDSRKSKAMKS